MASAKLDHREVLLNASRANVLQEIYHRHGGQFTCAHALGTGTPSLLKRHCAQNGIYLTVDGDVGEAGEP
jgi:hypothetical protein